MPDDRKCWDDVAERSADDVQQTADADEHSLAGYYYTLWSDCSVQTIRYYVDFSDFLTAVTSRPDGIFIGGCTSASNGGYSPSCPLVPAVTSSDIEQWDHNNFLT